MRVALDTNAYSDLKRGNEAVAGIVRRAEQLVISSVVLGELLYGFRCGSRLEQNLDELEAFLRSSFVRVTLTGKVTADRYARIAESLRAQGIPIPTNDIWIAAHAMEEGADLLSKDEHFARIPGLAWVRP